MIDLEKRKKEIEEEFKTVIGELQTKEQEVIKLKERIMNLQGRYAELVDLTKEPAIIKEVK